MKIEINIFLLEIIMTFYIFFFYHIGEILKSMMNHIFVGIYIDFYFLFILISFI